MGSKSNDKLISKQDRSTPLPPTSAATTLSPAALATSTSSGSSGASGESVIDPSAHAQDNQVVGIISLLYGIFRCLVSHSFVSTEYSFRYYTLPENPII